MSRLRYAGVTGTVGSGNMTNSATSHTFTAALTYGAGATVPTLTGSDYFMLSILDTSGNLSEVVKVTAYNSGTRAATIVRAQEGTTGVAHTSGDKVTLAAYATDFTQQDEVLIFALGDETTAITTGLKLTVRMPFAMTLTSVRASLTTASSSGIPAVNIKESGTTIFSTTLTIDATELTSQTAATAAVLSDTSLADDAEMTFIVDTAGTGAKGLKVTFIGTRT